MQFETWEPLYQAILEDFGFSRRRDEEAAELLRDLMREQERPFFASKILLAGRKAVVCGNAPCLGRELEEIQGEDDNDAVFLAADGAAAVLLERGMLPDIVV